MNHQRVSFIVIMCSIFNCWRMRLHSPTDINDDKVQNENEIEAKRTQIPISDNPEETQGDKQTPPSKPTE